MAIDFGKIFKASMWIIVGCLIFNLVLMGLEVVLRLLGFGAMAVGGKDIGAIAIIVNMLLGYGFLAISILGTFAIIIYGGFSGAKKGLDLISCGIIGLLAYGITDPIISVLRIIANVVLGLGGGFVQNGAAMGIFGGMFSGLFGLGFLVCGIGWFVGGLVVNFIVAVIGGLIGGAK